GSPGGTFRKRSKSSQEWMCSPARPRDLSSSATRCTVITSRKLPRWIMPDGEIPEAQTMVSDGPFRSRAYSTTASATRSIHVVSFVGGETGWLIGVVRLVGIRGGQLR